MNYRYRYDRFYDILQPVIVPMKWVFGRIVAIGAPLIVNLHKPPMKKPCRHCRGQFGHTNFFR
jgi:hypothetical protein